MERTGSTFVDVVIPLAVPGLFTYSVPDVLVTDMEPGKRVIVPFGRGDKRYTAIVAAIHHDEPETGTKQVLECLDPFRLVGEKVIQFWKWMSAYYMCTLGEVMHAALPGMLNLSGESRVLLNRGADWQERVTDQLSRDVLHLLDRRKEMRLHDLLKQVGSKAGIGLIKRLAEDRVVFLREEVSEKYKPRRVSMLRLAASWTGTEDLHRLLEKMTKAPVQQRLLMRYLDLSGWSDDEPKTTQVKREVLLREADASAAALKALVTKGIFMEEVLEESRLGSGEAGERQELLLLNEEQERTLKAISGLFQTREVVLLHGVTSSGKTEVYVHLIAEQLRAPNRRRA